MPHVYRGRALAIAFLSLSAFGLVQAQTWTQLSPSAMPPARGNTQMVFDSARGQIVLFGGVSSTNASLLSDTWLWNGVTWTQASPTNVPPARSNHALAFDAQRGQMVLFGGRSGGKAVNDTWVWDGANWTQKTPATSPSPRWGHLMAYDPVRKQTILFGGYNGTDSDGETWIWDGTTWTKQSPTTNPLTPESTRGYMAYDSVAQAVVYLYGYYLNGKYGIGTSAWNGTTWVNKAVSEDYIELYQKAAYHKDRFLFVRSIGVADQTLTVDASGLQVLTAPSPVSAFLFQMMAYDPVRDRTIVLAQDSQRNVQTWAFDFGKGCAFTAASGAGGGTINLAGTASFATFDVTLGDGCAWSATAADSWLTISPSSGTGRATVTVSAPANAARAQRTTAIKVGQWYSYVTQDMLACPAAGALPASPFTVFNNCPTTYSYTAAAGEQIAVRAVATRDRSFNPSVKIWNPSRTTTLASSPAYAYEEAILPETSVFTFPSAGTYLIEISSAGPSDGVVTVEYLRSGTGCTPTVGSFYLPGATTSVAIPAQGQPAAYVRALVVGVPPGCSTATVSSGATWLAVSPATASPGYTTLSMVQEPNLGAAERSTTLTIGSKLIPATQAASTCGYALNNTATSVDASRNVGELTLTTNYCGFTASSNASWLQVFPLSAASTSGLSTSLRYTVFPNFGTKTRTAALTIGGKTFTVTQAPGTGNAMERFVKLLYFNFFGRMPTVAEVAYQVNSGQSRAQLASNFFTSQEFTNGGRFVAGLYVGLLNRDAEYGGWLFQRDALVNGINTYDPLIRNFLDSQEFYLRYNQLTDSPFVSLLYRQILLREPTAAELTFQTTQLSGGTARSILALSFLLSQEFAIGTGPRLVAFLSYAGLLQRDPTPTEFEAAKSATVANLLNQIVNSSEFNTILE